MDLKVVFCECELDSSGSGRGLAAGCFDSVMHPCVLQNGGEFLDCLLISQVERCSMELVRFFRENVQTYEVLSIIFNLLKTSIFYQCF
jgi:hypothetical protein